MKYRKREITENLKLGFTELRALALLSLIHEINSKADLRVRKNIET